MFEVSTLLTFTAAVILLAITPGPDLFLIIGRGVTQGKAPALMTALGFFLAGAVQIPLLALGIANAIKAYPFLFDMLKIGGAAFLVWRGFQMIRYAGGSNIDGDKQVSSFAALKEGFIASLVNPKSHVFLLAFLPQFVDPTKGDVALQFVILGVIMRVVALIIEIIIAIFSGSIGAILMKSKSVQVWADRVAGTLVIAIGVRIFFLGRPEV